MVLIWHLVINFGIQLKGGPTTFLSKVGIFKFRKLVWSKTGVAMIFTIAAQAQNVGPI